MDNTITIIQHGHIYTAREVLGRPKSRQVSSFGGLVTEKIPQPNFNDMKNMALVSCRKLSNQELKEKQND